MGSGSSIPAIALSEVEAIDIVKKVFTDAKGPLNPDDILKSAKVYLSKPSEESSDAQDPAPKTEAPDVRAVENKVVLDRHGEPLSLDQQRVRKLREIFAELDADNDKRVSKSEFLEKMSPEIGAEEAAALFKRIDENESGQFTVSKLLHFVVIATISLMQEKFKAMDVDGNRQLTEEEFSTFFRQGGNSKKTTARLWNRLDANSNGKVNFKEWKTWAESVLALESVDKTFGDLFAE